jgi:hypothetical protein
VPDLSTRILSSFRSVLFPTPAPDDMIKPLKQQLDLKLYKISIYMRHGRVLFTLCVFILYKKKIKDLLIEKNTLSRSNCKTQYCTIEK